MSWPEDLQPFARSSLRKARSMFEVLEHAFEGGDPFLLSSFLSPLVEESLLARRGVGKVKGQGGGHMEVDVQVVHDWTLVVVERRSVDCN